MAGRAVRCGRDGRWFLAECRLCLNQVWSVEHARLVNEGGFGGIVFTQRGHASGVEKRVGFVQGCQCTLLLQPTDDGRHPVARLRAAQTFALAHIGDDRGRLQDARGQPGLAQPVLAMQVLREEIAKWMAHPCPLPSGGGRQTANDLRKKQACYSQPDGATLYAVD